MRNRKKNVLQVWSQMKDNFMQVTFHCVSILGEVWFLSYSQSKCVMSDRAHEGSMEFQKDYVSGHMRAQWMSMG